MNKKELGKKVAGAVDALLTQITSCEGHSPSQVAPGTKGYFAAKALKELLDVKVIDSAYRDHIGDGSTLSAYAK